MKKKLKVLVLFDGTSPTKIDQDFSAEMKTPDWKTEANVMAALGALGYTAEHLAIFDDLDLLRQKLENFAPDVLFNLVEQFKNNPGFDQNIVSFLEMQSLPFTGCGSTGLTLCKHKGISKKILGYHRIHVPNFVVIPRGQRIARPKQLKFPIVVKPVKDEASYGISQASFVETEEQLRERVAFIHEKRDADVIAEEYTESVRRRTRPGARRPHRADLQTHLQSAHDRRLRAHRSETDGRRRGVFHRGESKSNSCGRRGLRAFSGQGGLVVSAIDRPDHPARDEDGSGLIGERLLQHADEIKNVRSNRPPSASRCL